MTRILVPLAEGFEEIEALAVIDILRRAGINVITAGLPGIMVTGAHGVKVVTDTRLIDVNEMFDGIVLPGGSPAYQHLMRSDKLLKMVESLAKKGKLLAAICGAPLILAKLGLLKDRLATAYPGLEKQLDRPRSNPVVIDKNIITSQGPGTAIEFALKIVEYLLGTRKAAQIRQEIVA